MIEKKKPLTKPPTTLTQVVKAARWGRGWNQHEVVKRSGMTAPEVCRIEKATTATLSGPRILTLARLFLEAPPTMAYFDEPSSLEGWVTLLVTLDAKGRSVTRKRRAA